MATTENLVFGNGGDTYSFSFPYLKIEDVRVELQEFDASQPVGDQIISRLTTQAFTIPVGNPTTIVFDAIGADTVYQTAPDGDVRVTSTNGYPVRIRIFRLTQADATPSTFFAPSAIRAQDLNDNFDQILYIMQEKENALISIQTGGIGDNVISTSAIQDDAVDASKLRDSVSTDSDRAVTTNHIRDNAITTDKIADGTIVDADINASAAIAGTKVSPNFGSQNIVTTGDAIVGSLNGGQLAGFRNILINGNLTINQRGVDVASVATGSYGQDRWKKTAGGMTQIIEDGNFEPGATYTLSGTGITTQQLTAPASGDWTLPDVPVTARKIQLELGTIATPFEYRPIGVELALCQRYYAVSSAYGWGYASAAGTWRVASAYLPVSMRTNPTISFFNASGSNVSGQTAEAISPLNFGIITTVGSAGGYTWLGSFIANAEL